MSTPPLGETLFGFSRSFLWILYPGSRRRSLAESHVSVTRAMSIYWSVRNLPSSGSLFFTLVAFHRILTTCGAKKFSVARARTVERESLRGAFRQRSAGGFQKRI